MTPYACTYSNYKPVLQVLETDLFLEPLSCSGFLTMDETLETTLQD